MLLEKILQSQGFGSRKYCQQIIKNGSVTIENQICDNPKQNFPTEHLSFEVFGEEYLIEFKLKDVDLTPYKKMKLTDKVAFKEALNLYHTITRACDIGTKMFVDSLPKEQIKKEYTIQEIIDITKGQYRSDVFADFFLKGE